MVLSCIKRYPFSIITLVAIAYLSFFHPPSLRVASFPGMDKLAHFLMYAGLSGVLWIELLFNHKRGMVSIKSAITSAFISPIVLGAIIEVLQEYLTAYRQGDILDFLANTSGVMIASLIAWYVFRPIILRK